MHHTDAAHVAKQHRCSAWGRNPQAISTAEVSCMISQADTHSCLEGLYSLIRPEKTPRKTGKAPFFCSVHDTQRTPHKQLGNRRSLSLITPEKTSRTTGTRRGGERCSFFRHPEKTSRTTGEHKPCQGHAWGTRRNRCLRMRCCSTWVSCAQRPVVMVV